MPFKNAGLSHSSADDSTELMLSLITCVGIASGEQVLFEDENMIFMMLSFDIGVN